MVLTVRFPDTPMEDKNIDEAKVERLLDVGARRGRDFLAQDKRQQLFGHWKTLQEELQSTVGEQDHPMIHQMCSFFYCRTFIYAMA